SSDPSADPTRDYFTAVILIALSASNSVPSSFWLVGYLLKLRMNDTRSATCSRLRLPGLSAGIVARMRSKREPTVSSFQLALKSVPESAGAVPLPASCASWHAAHCIAEGSDP